MSDETIKKSVKKAARKRGPSTLELMEMMEQMKGQIDSLTERAETAEQKLEQVNDAEARLAEWEAEQDRLAKERYDQQVANRKNPSKRLNEILYRDPNVIREMTGDDLVKVEAVARIGLGDDMEGRPQTSEIGEIIRVPREVAIKLQDAGKVKVAL